MNKEKMIQFIEIENPITYNSVRVDFQLNKYEVGFFTRFEDYEKLKEHNKWRFVRNNLSIEYQSSKSISFSIIIDGDEVTDLTLL